MKGTGWESQVACGGRGRHFARKSERKRSGMKLEVEEEDSVCRFCWAHYKQSEEPLHGHFKILMIYARQCCPYVPGISDQLHWCSPAPAVGGIEGWREAGNKGLRETDEKKKGKKNEEWREQIEELWMWWKKEQRKSKRRSENRDKELCTRTDNWARDAEKRGLTKRESEWRTDKGRERAERCWAPWKPLTTLIILYFLQTRLRHCELVPWDITRSSFSLRFNSTPSSAVFYI